MKVIRGKNALVTGAGAGIGRAISRALARLGADLCLVDICEERLNETAKEIEKLGVRIVTMQADLTQTSAVDSVIAGILDRWGRIDILVNNAGILHYGSTHRMSFEQWQHLLALNLHAPIQFTARLLPILLAQQESHILNVASMTGLVAGRKLAAYQVSKFGLVGLSESLRAEYAGTGLGVTALCPGFVVSDLFDSASVDANRDCLRRPPRWLCTTPDVVAKKSIDAIYGNRGLVLVTPLAKVLWMLKRLSPGMLDLVKRIGWRRRRPSKSSLTECLKSQSMMMTN